jgi:hypothetical protein
LEHHQKIKQNEKTEGERAKFIHDQQGDLYYVNLFEKLLVPILSKFSNFVPEAGIWLNTQRPEWNDANNALVGYGASMVTLYYMRRHIKLIKNLVVSSASNDFIISGEVANWFNATATILGQFREQLKGNFSDINRKKMTDELGDAGSNYRMKLYTDGFTGDMKILRTDRFINIFDLLLDFIDHSIRVNRRTDRLYHSYNLLSISDNAIRIRNLYEMLEGQVAVLSSGLISATEVVDLLDALRNSKLYREDQSTYLLYPDRQLPRFTEKNNIPPAEIDQSELLQALVKTGNTEIVVVDTAGGFHFNGDFRNAAILRDRLKKLGKHYQPLVEKEAAKIGEIYEKMFDHQSFTGRSGTFFKYEGLGSTYWHMISKLVLAVQENYFKAVEENADKKVVDKIKEHYHEIKAGIGVKKSPDLYGGFPTDPYSHTPGHAGVQQPGMTGQVKEDVISRWGELGIKIKEGCITFMPGLLKKHEYLKSGSTCTYYDSCGIQCEIELPQHSIFFTIAQVPVVMVLSDKNEVKLADKENKTVDINDLKLDREISRSIFKRDGKTKLIRVSIKDEMVEILH